MEAKEYRGLWWLPSNKERKVAGVLAYTPGEEFRLELIGSFNAEYDGTILAPLKAKTMEPVIHGQASDGSNITLFDSTCGVMCRVLNFRLQGKGDSCWYSSE